MNKALINLCVLCILFPSCLWAQCEVHLYGIVYCAEDGQSLPGANIILEKPRLSTQTDSNGLFQFKNLCLTSIRLNISYVGFEKLDTAVLVQRSDTLIFFIHAAGIHLHKVEVSTTLIKRQEQQTLVGHTLSTNNVQNASGKNLSDMLTQVPGMSAIKSGTGIGKPVIHGLHSNRVLILNDGVRLEGQQWGSEHAPELDASDAHEITVVHGAASLRYGADAMGGVIMVLPPPINNLEQCKGNVGITTFSNGRGYNGTVRLMGPLIKKWGITYRLSGVYQKSGDNSTPQYRLANTGSNFHSVNTAVGYQNKKWSAASSFVQYQSNIGMYAGAQIGGDSSAIINAYHNPQIPKSSAFTYKIERAYQHIVHQIWKNQICMQGKYSKWTAMFARQQDRRKEYGYGVAYANNGTDLSNNPDADYQLITHQGELINEHTYNNKWSGAAGVSYHTQGNIFKGLGYSAIIPNFRAHNAGVFLIQKYATTKTIIESGLRYDFKNVRIYKLNPNTLAVESPSLSFENLSANIGISHTMNDHVNYKFNFGRAWRPPSVYELFAAGVHNSNSTYEIGNESLRKEISYHAQASIVYTSKKLQLETGMFFSLLNQYIFANPSLAFVTTYQGTYRRYDYSQANASFTGIDAQASYRIIPKLEIKNITTLLWAKNMTADNFLPQIPPQRTHWYLTYTLSLGKSTVNICPYATYTARQYRYTPGSEFVAPPPAFTLYYFEIKYKTKLFAEIWELNLTIENIFNKSYRDYMNHFRYFSDEPGRNFYLRLHIPFGNSSQKIKALK